MYYDINVKPVTKLTFPDKKNFFDINYHYFEDNLELLKDLNEIYPKSLDKYLQYMLQRRKKRMHQLNKSENHELTKFIKFIRSIPKAKNKRSFVFKNKRVSEIITEQHDVLMSPFRFNLVLKEMSLIYLISEFEQFLYFNLKHIFSSRSEMMKSGKKQITYEELFNFKDFNDIKENLIERETNSIINQDIDEINNYLNKRFRLDLSKNKDWKKFKECFYRRNICVHNKCCPNELYRLKTGYNGQDVKIIFNKDYLVHSIKLFEEYGKIIRDFLSNKFKSEAKMRYTF